jgi:ABC-type transport system involved in cytochrome c biogenesis permease subunit
MKQFVRGIPPELLAVLVVALVAVRAVWPERSPAGKLDLVGFAHLPVVADGRMKPLDTVARTSLMIISDKQTFKDEKDNTQPAIQWLIDVYGSDDPFGGPGAKHRVFRIVDLELLSLLELPQRPLSWRYSLSEMQARYDRLERELNRVQATKDEKRTPFDAAVLDLGKRLRIYEQLARRKTPLMVPPQAEGEEWRSVADADSSIVAPIAKQLHSQVTQDVIQRLRKDGVKIEELNKQQEALLELVIEKEFANKAAAYASANRAKAQPTAAALVNLMATARSDDATKANALLREFHTNYLSNVSEADTHRIDTEYTFNRAEPFYLLTIQYVFVFVLACMSWVVWHESLRRAAFGLLICTVALHTAALFVRMYLMERPFVFVTNLYSSAVFIGWACAILGLGVELIYRNGVGSAVAAVAGSLSLVVAHFLSLDGDQLQMLQAVLDTDFWLATHVTTVTLGYSATFMAGFFGIAFVLARLLVRDVSPNTLKTLSQNTYGIICFAMLFSFVGTVLGGIWADQSWGRFWGWDPKENGALMIVIWNALVLHARWAGLAKQRGVAVLAIFGCVVTTWSWFGTNQLGVGLHSYGFTSGRTMAIVLTSLTFAGLGLLGLAPIGRTTAKAPTR